MPAARAASTPVASKTSEKCSTRPAPLEAITGMVTASATDSDQPQIEAQAGAVPVDGVEQDLPSAQILAGPGQLHRVDVAPLTPALDGALVPAPALTVGARLGTLEAVVAGLLRVVDIDPPGVDGDDHGLVAIDPGDLLDGGGAVLVAAGQVLLDRLDGVAADGDLVRP